MEEYRIKLKEQDTTETQVHAATGITPPGPGLPGKTSLGYINLGLPSRLTLDDDDEGLNWATNSSLDTQSVDQEYSAYAFGTLAKIDVDILQFWEVCNPIIFKS
jgi:hypothetical protein